MGAQSQMLKESVVAASEMKLSAEVGDNILRVVAPTDIGAIVLGLVAFVGVGAV